MNRRKKWLIFLVTSLLVIIGIFWIISLNQESLEFFIGESVNRYSFFGIFVFSFLADMLIQPIGPEVPALIGVLFNLGFLGVIIFALLGSYFASLINYYIGKYLIRSKLEQLNRFKKRFVNLSERYGKWGLAIAAITPVPWVPFCWFVGSTEMKLRQFIFYGLIPRTARIVVIVSFVDVLSGVF